MSMTTGQRKYTKREMGYEESPPRCGTCVHYRHSELRRHKTWDGGEIQAYAPPLCSVGGFKVTAASLCNHWIDRNGCTIES